MLSFFLFICHFQLFNVSFVCVVKILKKAVVCGRRACSVLTSGFLFLFSFFVVYVFRVGKILKRFWRKKTAVVWKRQLAQFWPRDFCRSSATAALTLAVARFGCTCTVVLCGACKNTDFSCLRLSDPFFSCWCVFAQKKRKDCQPLSRPMTRGR